MLKKLQIFIKDNKEFINKNQWYLLFDSWMSFADYVYPNEENYLFELLHVFKTAGITVDMHERKKYMIEASDCSIFLNPEKSRATPLSPWFPLPRWH